jgi:hypothetical protein
MKIYKAWNIIILNMEELFIYEYKYYNKKNLDNIIMKGKITRLSYNQVYILNDKKETIKLIISDKKTNEIIGLGVNGEYIFYFKEKNSKNYIESIKIIENKKALTMDNLMPYGNISYRNILKGKIFEEIFKLFFIELNYKIINYGYEHILKELSQEKVKENSYVLEKVKKNPDFIVINNKTKKCFFIEIKYRAKITDKELEYFIERYDPETYLIIITRESPFLQISKIKNLKTIDDFFLLKECELYDEKNFKILEKYVFIIQNIINKKLFYFEDT